jgi:SAM-dependent methyltransferase
MIKYWHPKKINKVNDSPSREYSNQFLHENIEFLFPNKEIKILDIGCGSGYVRETFFNLGYKLDYTGIDIYKHKNFDDFNKFSLISNFVKSKIEDFNTIDKYDLIFSICALEHVKDDDLAFLKVRGFLKEKGIEIHIIPTKWSLFLYLRHGYRRYSPARLKKLFKGGNFEIYRLGGLFSFLLHFFFITIPKRIFQSNLLLGSRLYPKLLVIANKLDPLFPVFPSFYVVVNKHD